VFAGKIGPDPRNFNQRVSLGRNDLLIRTFLKGFQFVVGQIVFVFFITFSSVSLEVQRLRHNSHSCLVM
jgi:hypothetical protein